MDSIAHLRELFDYDDWANRRLIVALKNAQSQRSLQILGHLLITKQEYFLRLHGKDSTDFNFWPPLDLGACASLAKETAEKYERLLKTFDDEGLSLTARYRTSEGIPYSNTYRQLLTHVLFHSAIHRGNIVLKLREEGFEPPKIDYIIYLRETNAAGR